MLNINQPDTLQPNYKKVKELSVLAFENQEICVDRVLLNLPYPNSSDKVLIQ